MSFDRLGTGNNSRCSQKGFDLKARSRASHVHPVVLTSGKKGLATMLEVPHGGQIGTETGALVGLRNHITSISDAKMNCSTGEIPPAAKTVWTDLIRPAMKRISRPAPPLSPARLTTSLHRHLF